MKTGRIRCAIAALIAGTAVGSVVSADVIYGQTFESQTETTLPEWSPNQLYAAHTNFSRFLGRYNNHSVRLTVALPADYVQQQAALGPRDVTVPTDPDPAPQTRLQLLLEFDLYVIDSWDGWEPTHGIDSFGVNANGEPIFLETFANVHGLQSYDGTPTVDRVHLGYNLAYADSTYRLSIPFDVYDSDVALLDFAGSGLLGAMGDESWGIDNITVSVQTVAVPAPGAAGLLGLGTLAGLRRRRR